MKNNIYEYIKEQQAAYETQDIRVGNNWPWNMNNHVQLIFHLKNSQFYTGNNNYLRSFKNVMEPILNLSYWSEDIELKDILFYVDNDESRVLSFFLKKYHDEVYVKEHDIDTLLDEIAEEDIDYGGVLVQKGLKRPEVIYMPSVAFCDQTDIEGGPIGIRFDFTPSKLRTMAAKGWGDEKKGATVSIEELITLAGSTKQVAGNASSKNNETGGKNIELYVVRGSFPQHYLDDSDNMEDYSEQVHVVGFYTDEKGNKEGVSLFRMKHKERDIMFHTSKAVYGRGLGRGVGEGLLHPQIWTNFLEIHKMKMLEAGSKTVLYTDDESYTDTNKVQDMENLEITTIGDGKKINQVPTSNPTAVALFERATNEWYENAQAVGSAFDPMMGKEPVSGTTFRGQERTVQQGRGIHDRRRGQRAKFIEKIYREMIIPDLVKEILKGGEFLATLSADELRWVSERVVENRVAEKVKDMIFNLKAPTKEMEDVIRQDELEKFSKTGNKQLIKILEGQFENVAVTMGINVAGKQKNLAAMTDKLLSIFQFIFTNPQGFQQVMQMDGMQDAFNDILEFSGVSGVDFTNLMNSAQSQQPQQAASQSQQQQLEQQNA